MGKRNTHGRAWAAVTMAAVLLIACGGDDEADPNAPEALESAMARSDYTAPTLSIESPTKLATHSSLAPTVHLQGVAKDDKKIARVTWATRVGSGVAELNSSGASATWSIPALPLLEGDNSVTLRAYDAENNKVSRKILVTYTTNPQTVNTAEGTWTTLADENEGFVVTETKRVRFGSTTAWVERTVAGPGDCTTSYFGTDPSPGTIKTCSALTEQVVVPTDPGTGSGTGSGTGTGTGTGSGTDTGTGTGTTSSGGSPSVDPTAYDPAMDTPREQLPAGPIPAGSLVLAAGELRWSDPATWGGSMPGDGAEVVVPAGRTVVLDVPTASLGALRIEGTLRFAPRDLALTAKSIQVSGALEAGSPTEPFIHRATITLTGAPAATNDGVSRGLLIQGGRLALHGAAPQPVWTRINDHAAAGARSLTLASTVNWRSGDTLAVAPSDFHGVSVTDRVGMTTVSGKSVSLSGPLPTPRWGKLQYVTANGMSLVKDDSYVPPAAPAPTILDQRAAVANLSRNIVIQGADDAHWANGFGVHVMIMNLSSRVVVDGIEIRRAGQAGSLGRYPFHWHMLSYVGGAMVGDATGHIIRNSSVWNSSQRCIVVHATNGVQVLNNVCHDIKGHAFFLEDAVERRNIFDGNIALKMRMPMPGKQLLVNEGDVYQGGPSGFWLTNPDNIVRNNLGADAEGNGFWLAFPRKPLGLSASVPMIPDRMKMGLFEHNVAHSNRGPGVLMNWVPNDAAGNVIFNQYMPTVDGGENDWTNLVKSEVRRITSYKNLFGGYANNISLPDYQEWMLADNVGTGVNGKVHEGRMVRSLLVGTSLNNATPYPDVFPNEKPTGFATYHSTLAMEDNTLINFPFHEGGVSGAWKADDYYIAGVDRGTARNINNRLVASNAGFRPLPPHLDGQPLANRHWSYSGALWDPHGYWGPKGQYQVYDVPFLTTGANCVWVTPAGKNGKSCDGEYMGFDEFQTSFDMRRYDNMAPLESVRQDANGGEIGRWSIADGDTSTKLGNMRHFAARPGGRYVVRFPGKPIPSWVAFTIRNAYRASDSVTVAVSFSGAVNAAAYTVSGQEHNRENPPDRSYVRNFTPVSSLAEVTASTGPALWQDRANNLVWLKYRGGMAYPNEANLKVNSDEWLNRANAVVIQAQ